jgi:hypothetical protein
MTRLYYFKEVMTTMNDNPAIVAFCENEIKKIMLTDVFKTADRQTQNEILKCEILNALADGGELTITEIINARVLLGCETTQKVSALLALLINEKKVIRVIPKKGFFRIARFRLGWSPEQ